MAWAVNVAGPMTDEVLGLVLQPGAGTVGVVLAALAVGVLVEGPVVTVLAGSLAGAGLLEVWAVWLVALAADLVSDSVFYLLGRGGQRPRVARLLLRLGLTERRREALSTRVRKNLGQVVIGAKLVDLGAIPAFLAIGLTGVRAHRFLAWAAAASAVRTAVLVGIGWYVGGRFASELVDRPWIIVVAGVGTGLVLLAGRTVWMRISASRKENACAS